MSTNEQRQRVLRLAEKLLGLIPKTEEGLLVRAHELRDRLKTPMSMVLDKVPGETVTEKAATIGITRQAYYAWYKGEYRPNKKQSKRLANLTGFNIEDIRGR